MQHKCCSAALPAEQALLSCSCTPPSLAAEGPSLPFPDAHSFQDVLEAFQQPSTVAGMMAKEAARHSFDGWVGPYLTLSLCCFGHACDGWPAAGSGQPAPEAAAAQRTPAARLAG